MLVDVDTGYEGKFDFPARAQGPEITYLLASIPRAGLTGVWRKEQEAAAPEPVEYSQEALETVERGIAFQEATWEQMFNDLRIEPLPVWHEDVLADPAAAAQHVADYLRVAIEPGASVQIPQIRQQSEGDKQVWIDRYARSGE